MLKMFGQDVCGELGNVPDNKGVVVFAPRHDGIGGGVVDHVVGFAQKRCHTNTAVPRCSLHTRSTLIPTAKPNFRFCFYCTHSKKRKKINGRYQALETTLTPFISSCAFIYLIKLLFLFFIFFFFLFSYLFFILLLTFLNTRNIIIYIYGFHCINFVQ